MPYLRTPFKIEPHPNGATWKEEIWTERLGNGMKKYIRNDWTVMLGTDIEFDGIQYLCSGISYVNSKQFYLFSGQPDITLLRESPETTSIINVSLWPTYSFLCLFSFLGLPIVSYVTYRLLDDLLCLPSWYFHCKVQNK